MSEDERTEEQANAPETEEEACGSAEEEGADAANQEDDTQGDDGADAQQKDEAQEDEAEQEQQDETDAPEDDAPEDVDIADEEELDIEIARVAPKKRSGGAYFIGFVVIVIAAVLCWFGLRMWDIQQQTIADAKEKREAQYETQKRNIEGNLKKAAKAASEGKVTKALDELQNAHEKWDNMRVLANSAGDTGWAGIADGRKRGLEKAIKELEKFRGQAAEYTEAAAKLRTQATELAAKRDALNEKVRKGILAVADPGASAEAKATDNKKPEADKGKKEPEKAKKSEDKPAKPKQKAEPKPKSAKDKDAKK